MTLLQDPVVGAGALLFIAAVMAGAVLHKLRDFVAFRETLRDYRLLPEALAPAAAAGIVLAEASAVLLLVFPGLRLLGAWLAATLLLLYAGALAINLARGRTEIDCGCSWGASGQAISGWLVVRNVVLLPFAALAGTVWTSRAVGFADGLVALAAGLALLLFYHAADRLIANWSGLRPLRHAH